MPEIDYKKYLEGLGVVETNQEKVIQEYLEKQCETDEALRSVYRPEKIKDCYVFIRTAVEKMQRDGNCACIEHPVVFKMARDYFIEILPNLKKETEKKADGKTAEAPAEEKPVDVTPVQETVKEVTQQIEKDAASDNVKRDEYGFEIFGEEDEEPEEAEEEQPEEPCDQEDVGEEEKVLQPVASDTPKYDENGCGLLFDFD